MKLRAYKMIGKLPNPKKIAKILLTSVVCALLLLSMVPWQQFALGSGKVIAYSPTHRLHTVNSPIEGRIKKWFVDEGMSVKPNDPIVEISDNDPQIMSRLELEKKAIHNKIAAINQAIIATKNQVTRQKSLFEKGINSKRQYELAQIDNSKYENELAQAKIEELNIDVRIARQNTQLLRAQEPGVVYRRLTGQETVVVKAGDVLAHIMPDVQTRAAEIFIDGNDIPFVRTNQKVRLQFEGWPAIQFRGWPQISVGTFGGRIAFIDPTDNGVGSFRAVVVPDEPWPEARFLRQGVRVNGWVQLGRVPLWYEIWRQFNGFPPENGPKSVGS